jgi:putative membrane protein
MTDKLIFRFVAGVSIFVFLVVLILNRKIIPPPAHLPSFIYFLPKLNAILNGTCAVLLVISLMFIRSGNITMHKRVNITAFCLSALFLVSYILFHYMAPETIFGDLSGDGVLDAEEKAAIGGIRTIYLVILISHIILAAAVLPLILLSFYRGLQMQVEKHRRLVRWTFPIWLYVTVTGVVVYILISPYYHFIIN